MHVHFLVDSCPPISWIDIVGYHYSLEWRQDPCNN